MRKARCAWQSLDDEQVALINDNKSVQLPKGAAGFVPGDTAKLKGMKTESLNGKTVTLIEWKDKQNRWKVQAEGEKILSTCCQKSS